MSHELRTPLNSLLILAQELTANPDGNLLPKQIEYATIIRSSGTDLLKLINDILDLSKIESGTVTLDIANWPLAELKPMLDRTFRHVAEATKLSFAIDLRPGLPDTIPTDPQRLQQILNNLLSNAFKFTEKGRVEFVAQIAISGWSPSHEVLSRAAQVVAFSVIDTGIGIPGDKQHSIFESFAQADGTTSRKYGGTGLGLSICRELTRLLGGEIKLESELGVGSAFTVYLPVATPAQTRRALSGGKTNGRSDGSRHSPEPVGATVALGAGWHVEAAHAVAEREPAERQNTVLVVEDDPFQRQHIVDLMEPVDADVIAVGTGEDALALLEDQKFDCIVLDLGLPGLSGWQVIDHLRGNKALRSVPLVVYTARDLTKKEELKLGRATKSIVVKEVRSPERLKEEVIAILDESAGSHSSVQPGSNGTDLDDSMLSGKKVLVVDDDIRNIFALTAMLERHQMDVVSVDSGQEALATLGEHSDIDLALVDVMMPEMDGYETMTRMRLMPTFGDRPIIALTAKAMVGDREKCIEAGASDYIAKPVNTPELLKILKSWLAH
jgi:CheY-like chemotaxis protein